MMDDEQHESMPEDLAKAYDGLRDYFNVSGTPEMALIEAGPTRVVKGAVVGNGSFTAVGVPDGGEIPDALKDGFEAVAVIFTTLDDEDHWFLLNPESVTKLSGQLAMAAIERLTNQEGPYAEMMAEFKKLDEGA